MIPRAKSVCLIAAAVTLATACGHPVQRKLEGRWLGDGVEQFPDEHIAPATGWAKGLSFEFAGSDLTVTVPAQEPRSGKYKVAGAHNRDVRLSIVAEDGTQDSIKLRLDDEHSIRWMLGNGRAVLLHRQL